MNAEITKEEFTTIKKIPMVFIMGKERSGTTLLQTFLGGHPNIVAPPESEFILLLYPRFGKIKKWTEKNIREFIDELYKEPWITKIWRIDRSFLTSVLLSIREGADYASICKVIYYCTRNSKENIVWISDKNPIYILFIKTLLKIFPEAKFIHLIREPRDNVNSHLKSFKVNNVKFVAMKWVAYNTILMKAKIVIPEKFHTVRYEDLVESPAVKMKEICKFLNIDFNDRMVHNAFPENLKAFNNQQLILERAKQIHVNLLQPVNTSNIGKWKNDMSLYNIKLVEKIAGNFAAKNFNYVMEEGSNGTSIGMKIQIIKSRIIYYCWQFFTRMKYKSYWFNRAYTNFNILIGRETRVFGKVLRES